MNKKIVNKISKKQKSITLKMEGNKIYLDKLRDAIKYFYGFIDNVAKEVYKESKEKKPRWIVKDIKMKKKTISITVEMESKIKEIK